MNPWGDLGTLRCNSIPVALQLNFDLSCKAFPLYATVVIYVLPRGASSPSKLCNLEEWTQALVAINSSKVMSPRVQWRPLFLLLQLPVRILPIRVCAAAHSTGVCVCLVFSPQRTRNPGQEALWHSTKQHLSFLGVFAWISNTWLTCHFETTIIASKGSLQWDNRSQWTWRKNRPVYCLCTSC